MNHKIVTKRHPQNEFSAHCCACPLVFGAVYQIDDPGAGEDLEISTDLPGWGGGRERQKSWQTST